MIDAQFFVSGPDNSPPGSLYGHPTVVTAPPHQLLGKFLTGEIDSTRVPLFKLLPKVLTEIESGKVPKYQGGGEGHLFTISNNIVQIYTLYAVPEVVDELPIADFRDVLQRWLEFVKQHEKSRK